MEKIFILFLFLNLLIFSFSIVQNWNLENSAIDLLENEETKKLSKRTFDGTGYDMFVELYKYIAEENGAVVYRKYLNVYSTTTEPYTQIFNGEVDYDEIDSFYYLNSKYIVCPKGKFHPLVVYATNNKYELDVGNNWKEKGDWEHFLMQFKMKLIED